MHDLNNNCDARKPIFKVSDQASLFGFRDLYIDFPEIEHQRCRLVCAHSQDCLHLCCGHATKSGCYSLRWANIASKSRNAGMQTRMALGSLQKYTILIDLFV